MRARASLQSHIQFELAFGKEEKPEQKPHLPQNCPGNCLRPLLTIGLEVKQHSLLLSTCHPLDWSPLLGSL